MANGRDRDRDRDDKEKKKKRKRPSDQPVSTAVREALRTLPPPTPAPQDATTVARAPAAGRVLSQTFFERALREGRTQEQAPDYTRAYGVPRESLELPGVRPSVSPLSPPPSGPTRAGAYLEERYGHLRHTTPRLPQPGPVSEILALPGRAIRPLAEPIGRYVGATPEHERAIARFIRELGEPQPIPNPVERLTRGLSPETRQRIGRAMVTLSGIPALTEALSAGTELAGRALDAIVPEPVEEFARETLRRQGAQWALASPEMRRGRPLPAAIGALTGAMAGGWPGALAGALLGGLVDWEAPAAAIGEQFYAASGRPREEFEALFPGGRPPRITTTDRLLAELLDPATFLPGGVWPSAIANALSAAARPWSYEDESSALERALGAAVGTPAAIRGFEAGARALGEAARGAVSAGRALARPVTPALEQAWRLGREAIETAEAERAVRREVDNLAQMAKLARARGNEAAAQAIERELVRVATSIEPATPLQRALLAGRDVAGLASAAGLAAAATAVSGEQPGIEGERPATEQEAVTRPGEQARRFAAADTGAQPLVTPGALLTGLAAGAAGYALGRRRGEQERRSLARLAQVDELTGLANRRAFEAARPTADRSPDVEYLLLDLQNFKAVNDKLGLAAGDAELRKVADALRQAAREVVGTDERVFRFGGDEFAVLAPKGQGEAILQRARELYPGIDVEGYRTGIRGVIADTFDAADARMKAIKAEEGPRYRALPAVAAGGAVASALAAEEEGEPFPALAATLAGMGIAASPRFYSRLQKRIEEGPGRATVAQWRKHLEQDVSKVEREWTGVQEMLARLDPNAMLTKEELLSTFRLGRLRMNEVVLSHDAPQIRAAESQYEAAQAAAAAARERLTETLRRAGYDADEIQDVISHAFVRPPAPVPRALKEELETAREDVRQLVRRLDHLGYDFPGDAIGALLRDPDPMRTFDLPEEVRPIIERFRSAHAAVEEARNQPVSPEVLAALEDYRNRRDEVSRAHQRLSEARSDYLPQYHSYAEPGGKNYREILITFDHPSLRAPFERSHWHVPNVVGHARVTDRQTIDGQRILYVEEIQSDWAEKGRKSKEYGWHSEVRQQRRDAEKQLADVRYEISRLKQEDAEYRARLRELDERIQRGTEGRYEVVAPDGTVLASYPEAERLSAYEYRETRAPEASVRYTPVRSPDAEAALQQRAELLQSYWPVRNRLRELEEKEPELDDLVRSLWHQEQFLAVPDMPFRQTEDWVGLVMKRLIDEAVRGGYDALVWAPGDVHVDRYGLRGWARTLLYDPDNHILLALNADGRNFFRQKVKPDKLPDYVGKEVAERLLAQPRGKGEVEVFTTDEWEELGGRADPWFGDEPDEPYVIAKRDPETGEFEGVATAATREEAEEKVAQLESDRPRFHVLPRTNVEVGGEGMYAFYDKILPTWLKNYARKSGLDIQIEDFYLEPPHWSDVLLSYEGPALTLERLQEAAGRLRAEPGPSTADAQTLLETAIAFVGPNYRRLPEIALEEAVRRQLAAPYRWQMPRLQEALRTLERALGGRLRLVSREARPGFRITETIRRKVLEEGQPLLSVAAPIAGALTASGAASEGAEEAQSSQQAGKLSLAAAMAFMRPGRGRRRLIANVELTSNNDPRMVRFGELPAKVQEQFTRQAIREILRPIARSEGLSTRIVVGLGSWFEEGSLAVQRAGRYAFPATTPDETVHRVLARASLALKQSGYFAARPEPGTERWAIEVDFGRSLSPEEYIRHVEAMSQDAPTFRGTTMVSLSPARVQIVLDEGLGRDAVQQTLEHIAARLPDDYIITGNAYEVRTVEGYGEDWFLQVLDRRGLSEEQARVDREVHQRFERLANDVADATRRFLGSGGPGESGLRGLGAFALLPAAGALASSSEGSDEELPVLAATSIPAGFRLRILADPLAHQLWTRLRVLPPPAGQPILPHIPADAQRAILDALVNLRVARPGVTLAEAEQILRQLPQDQLRGFFEHVFPLLPTTQRMAAASAFPLPSPRYQAQPSASGAGSASPGFSWLAGQGYPLGPEYHLSLAASPSRGEDLVFEAGKPEGASPGAIFRDPYSGQQVLVKGASIIENPEAEAFVDRLSRALFTGLVPTVESEVVRGREAQELVQQVPSPVLRRALELGAREGGLYVRPFFPLREVETLWGEVTYGFPMAPTDAEVADALRAALIGRTVANVDLHAGNIAAFQGGRAGTIDAGLAFGRLATDPVVKSHFTAELFRQIITGRPIIPDAQTESVDVEAALRPLADRVRQLTRTDIERIGREALQAIRNWRVFRSEFSDPAMQDQARRAFERRLAELPDLIDRIIQAWRDAQQYPAGSPPRERIWRNLANAVRASAPIMAAAILADGFMTDEELWAADKAGLTGIVASLLPAGARRRFLKAVEDRATTAADRVLSRIDYSGMPAGERPTLSYQALRAYTYAIDRLAPIGRVTTEAARELGHQERRGFLSRLARGAEKGREQLPFRLDAETLARAAAGWQGYAAEVLERGVHLPGAIGETKTRGLNQILAEVGALPNVKLGVGTYTAHQALDAYRVAKRALELEDPARPGGPRKTGIDLDAARELVEQVERDYPDLVRLQRELVTYHDERLRLLEDEGVLRPGALDQMKAAGNREYTPFFRAGLERRGPTVGGKRLADLPDPVKRLVGSERELLPPSESDIRLTYAYANLLMRQRASNALAEIAEAWPDNPWIRRTRRPIVNVRIAKEQLKGQIDEDLLELIEPDFLSVWVGRRPSPGSNIIAVTREGKRVYYQTDPLLYEAIMGLTPRQMSFAERLLSAPAQWLRTGVTILPDFALANLIRDTVQVAATSEVKGPVLTAMARAVTDMLRGIATLMAASEASTVKRAAKAAAVGATFGALTPTGVGESDQEAMIRGIGALAGAAIAGGFGALAPQVSRGFTRSARSRPTARMKPEDLVAAWRSAGGDFAAYLSMDRESLSRSIREAIRQGQRFPIAWTPADAIRVFRAVNEALENANRMGEFLRQIDVAGQADVGTITRAAVAARDVSVDFKRHGLSRTIEVIRPLAAFWNARIQGLDKIVRAFVKDPRRTSAVLTISVTLPSLALWAINRDNPDYWEIPLWQRNLFWLVPIGTTTLEDGQKQTVFLRIPKPFELGILFGSLPERMVEAFDPKNPHRGGGRQIEDQAWEQFVGEVAGMFSPVPTAVQPWLEIWLNRDLFTGRTIHSIFEPEDMDPRLKGRDRASEVARLFSDVLNDVADSMDGTAIIRKFADFLRLSPAEVDHLFSSYLGGAGRLAVNAASRALRDEATRGPAPAGQLADAPLTGRFVARTPPPTSESEAQFGELWRRAQGLRATVTRWLEAGRPDDALRAIDQDPALFAAYESLRRTAEFLRRQRRFERLIEENPGMTAEEKRRTLDVIYRLNAEMSKAALDIYRIQREAMEER